MSSPDDRSPLTPQERIGAAYENAQTLRLEERSAPRSEIADQLRILASQVEDGTFVLGDKELDLPAMAEFQIAYRPTKQAGDRIRVKIEWGGTQTGLLSPE